MKIEEIRAIVKMMSDHDLTEFKIEAEEYNLCIKRGGKNVHPQIVAAPIMPAAAAAAAAAAANVANAASAATNAPDQTPRADDKPVESIDSPLVGTFYRGSSPEAAPFVQVGDRVTPDTTVCIIEAMKVMNEVKAEKSGVIKEIFVENGQAVEFGQVLFTLE